jgi:hypothetical protein
MNMNLLSCIARPPLAGGGGDTPGGALTKYIDMTAADVRWDLGFPGIDTVGDSWEFYTEVEIDPTDNNIRYFMTASNVGSGYLGYGAPAFDSVKYKSSDAGAFEEVTTGIRTRGRVQFRVVADAVAKTIKFTVDGPEDFHWETTKTGLSGVRQIMAGWGGVNPYGVIGKLYISRYTIGGVDYYNLTVDDTGLWDAVTETYPTLTGTYTFGEDV